MKHLWSSLVLYPQLKTLYTHISSSWNEHKIIQAKLVTLKKPLYIYYNEEIKVTSFDKDDITVAIV